MPINAFNNGNNFLSPNTKQEDVSKQLKGTNSDKYLNWIFSTNSWHAMFSSHEYCVSPEQ